MKKTINALLFGTTMINAMKEKRFCQSTGSLGKREINAWFALGLTNKPDVKKFHNGPINSPDNWTCFTISWPMGVQAYFGSIRWLESKNGRRVASRFVKQYFGAGSG
jgi:hypothetical protein